MPSYDDPDERCARPTGRATFRFTTLEPDDPDLADELRGWILTAQAFLARGVTPATRTRLEDSLRIVGELARVLAGEEEGEGLTEQRTVHAAVHRGRIQAITSLFVCPGAAFVELLATAPWNLLGPADPPDARTVRGAGSALVERAVALSRGAGAGGRVTLQAENPRAFAVYQRLGFERMRPSDAPLALVPRGKDGFSKSVVRLARGAAGPEEARAPWMLLDPGRAALRARRAGPRPLVAQLPLAAAAARAPALRRAG
ncbi:GNAT family N-acetyltransferase [Anaeromyxobacter dehalogenans]|uniref:GCN5-related N-acetyltransferase n=1 Tax=Anaeromyxobacter dehalogenans (strain 2CP-C) TaxID=290397 RepID=Q2IQP3_ANADE|nr:GNAT family N-acetyltransferase [Anaeromyxobacter dehalogenans]ABC81128.1 GCN5-related N-acetyltransferase [Anaeromyxobacter dehalogenans 2CP-C]